VITLRSRWLAVPLSAFVWASWVAIVILWTPLVLLFRAVTFPFDRRRAAVGRLFHASARLAGTLNPFWRFRLIGVERVDRSSPHVFVANHGSFTDIFAIVRLPVEIKWLSKKSILDIPLLGWQMRIAGDVPLVRGDKESAREAMEQMRRRLDDGASVILFPEGTRSEDGSLGAFRPGAFRLAIEAGADVVPLAVEGAAASLPKRSLLFRPAVATVEVLEPVGVDGLTPDDAPELADRVRGEIGRALERAAERSSAAAPVR
jgi:1-acyl-sn-glycerol-3-phosphate acyltransferase